MTKKYIINLEKDLKYEKWSKGSSYAGAEAPLATILGAKQLGFHMESLDPGKFSCPYHYHEKEEELFIIFEGEAIFRINDEFYLVRKGDLIHLLNGEKNKQQLYNHSDGTLKFFALSNMHQDEICHYPDSNKTFRAAEKKVIQDGVEVDYWKDEENPTKYWPEKIINGDLTGVIGAK